MTPESAREAAATNRLEGDLAMARNAVKFWIAENEALRAKCEALEAEVSRLRADQRGLSEGEQKS